MALYRILVVDDSPAVRETVGILLGNDYEVHAARVDDYCASGPPQPPPDLIIAARLPASAVEMRRFPSGVPVLWIDDGDGARGNGASLSRRFSPRELRRRVAELLSAPRPDPTPPRPADARLHEPFLPAAVTRGISSALATDLPLHLIGEPGTGKRTVAKAMHASRGAGPFLTMPAPHFDLAVLRSSDRSGGTLFIDNVERLDAQAQQTLLAELAPTGLVGAGGTGGGLRLVTASHDDLEAAVDAGAFAPALFYRITVLTVRLPALRDRSAEIPALARMIAAELGALLGRPQISFTERALERLANYLWFGNIAELEAVLARTIALSSEAVIDADALLFDARQLHGVPAAIVAPTRNGGATLAGRPLDLIINELAHEFKNPLVTIKTFAHHLRRALPRGGDDEQAARLTGEAVQQIDQTLENLLEFTRLETPVPQSVPLSAVLTPVFAECGRALTARGVALEHGAVPRITVRGDPQQLAYGLMNLLRALTRDLPAKARLTVRHERPATIVITLPEGTAPLGSHLATLLDQQPSDGSAAIPLGVAIANAVLERNGAQVAFADDTPATIIVRFTAADDETVVAGNGTSPRIGR